MEVSRYLSASEPAKRRKPLVEGLAEVEVREDARMPAKVWVAVQVWAKFNSASAPVLSGKVDDAGCRSRPGKLEVVGGRGPEEERAPRQRSTA